MRCLTYALCSTFVITILVLGGCCGFFGALPGDGFTLLPPGAPPSNIELMSQAEQIVWADYPSAMLIEAIGAATSGAANSADDIDQWLFIFPEDPNLPAGGTVQLHYAAGAFGAPVYVSQTWGGTIFERLPRLVSLADAVGLMRDAGHTGDFTGVVLRKPLTWPLPEEAFYGFSVSGGFVTVGAETGAVSGE